MWILTVQYTVHVKIVQRQIWDSFQKFQVTEFALMPYTHIYTYIYSYAIYSHEVKLTLIWSFMNCGGKSYRQSEWGGEGGCLGPSWNSGGSSSWNLIWCPGRSKPSWPTSINMICYIVDILISRCLKTFQEIYCSSINLSKYVISIGTSHNRGISGWRSQMWVDRVVESGDSCV